jgi:protein-tyrosine phosphatase
LQRPLTTIKLCRMSKLGPLYLVAACTILLALADALQAALPIVEVASGIYRGPAPETAADFRQLRNLGVRTVIDLRKFRRRKMDRTCRCVQAHGMNYIAAPIGFYPERDRSPDRAVRLLANAQRYPIYIHCELGRDRSGLVIGLFRVRCQGWSVCAAYAEMQRFGFNERLRGLDRYFWNHAN